MDDCLVQLATILNFCRFVLLNDVIKKNVTPKKNNFQPTRPPTNPKIQNGPIWLKIGTMTKLGAEIRKINISFHPPTHPQNSKWFNRVETLQGY